VPAAVSQPAPTAGQRFGKPFRQEPVTVPEETGESDVLEWKNLFISASEEQQFRKVRLCIVHKEDTLESIAKKYDRKPQELRLYNGLSDQEITEGQVIYIP
jgi:stage VI sporulation protein D